jgi:hypothetical protein
MGKKVEYKLNIDWIQHTDVPMDARNLEIIYQMLKKWFDYYGYSISIFEDYAIHKIYETTQITFDITKKNDSLPKNNINQ